MFDVQGLYDAVLNGDHKTAVVLTHQALDGGAEPGELISRSMIPAMEEAGKRFECEDYFVPELLLAARAMKASLEILRPLLTASGAQPVGRVIVGTVKGDLHDIGKNLVASMLEGAGFEVTDLGADVAPEKFVEAVSTGRAQILCLSALLTVTMPAMRTVVDALNSAGLRDRVRILVGGAPVTQQFADDIGADGYGENANTAVALARRFAGTVN
jgi:corrinoid protein of di/trimethylamine methyltransferase